MGQDILKIISSNASIFVLEAAVMNQIKVFLGCDMKVVSQWSSVSVDPQLNY